MKSLDYFIEMIEEFPEEYIGVSSTDTDVWEWLVPEDAQELYAIIKPTKILLVEVNDGLGMYSKFEETPKRRVLKYLNYVNETRKYYE